MMEMVSMADNKFNLDSKWDKLCYFTSEALVLSTLLCFLYVFAIAFWNGVAYGHYTVRIHFDSYNEAIFEAVFLIFTLICFIRTWNIRRKVVFG